MASPTPSNGARKRAAPVDDPRDDDDSSSSSDDETGPALPSAADTTNDNGATTTGQRPRKKRRTLPHEKLYLAALPTGAARYAKSLMHKDRLAFVKVTPRTDFLITAGAGGQVSFWKKGGEGSEGVEFVKEFKAHTSGSEDGEDGAQPALVDVSVSWDGALFASVGGTDGTIKVWDVETFDLVTVLQPEFSAVASDGPAKKASCICWVHGRGRGLPLLAAGNDVDGEVLVLDGRGEATEPMARIKTGRLHKKPVIAMAYNHQWDCVVSADETGMVEYWQPDESLSKPSGVWATKAGTGLFDFKKAKSIPTSITVSPTGKQFATFSFPDRQVRVFDFASGKLYRTYDESLQTLADMQQAGTAAVQLDQVEFGRRLAVERELDQPALRRRANVIWDETGNFVLYGSLHGVKVINVLTNRVLRVYGRDESLRALNLALYQGQPQKKGVVTIEMAASENPLLQEAEARDALLVTTAPNRVRFYMYTNEADVERSTRDVQNERPRMLDAGASKKNGVAEDKKEASGTKAIMHTTYGDILLNLFPAVAPKAVENFVVHSRRGYYNGVIFHRVIRKFMIQTGDPLGDGTGGESIWGAAFEDEISPALKHDKPYCLSMANAGPATNGSQFFITTERTPWLDGKHTIFGRATGGLDVVHRIENTRVSRERPHDDIRIVSIDIS